MVIRDHLRDGGAVRAPRHSAWLLLAGLGSGSIAGCGLGSYDDTGGAAPASSWTFVCADGGGIAPEAGCLAPVCPDGGPAGEDGGCE